jgi:hypothetical protein
MSRVHSPTSSLADIDGDSRAITKAASAEQNRNSNNSQIFLFAGMFPGRERLKVKGKVFTTLYTVRRG